jgi:hypothetical protein
LTAQLQLNKFVTLVAKQHCRDINQKMPLIFHFCFKNAAAPSRSIGSKATKTILLHTMSYLEILNSTLTWTILPLVTGNPAVSRSKLNHFDPMKVSVTVNQNRHPGKIKNAIRYHVNGTALKSYIAHRNQWSSFNTFCVDWYSFGLNFRQLRPTEQVQYMKFIHSIQPLGWKRYQISKSKEVILFRYPCCKTAVENPVHFLTCPTQRPSRYRHFRAL